MEKKLHTKLHLSLKKILKFFTIYNSSYYELNDLQTSPYEKRLYNLNIQLWPHIWIQIFSLLNNVLMLPVPIQRVQTYNEYECTTTFPIMLDFFLTLACCFYSKPSPNKKRLVNSLSQNSVYRYFNTSY